jgi:hypothetical protein
LILVIEFNIRVPLCMRHCTKYEEIQFNSIVRFGDVLSAYIAAALASYCKHFDINRVGIFHVHFNKISMFNLGSHGDNDTVSQQEL